MSRLSDFVSLNGPDNVGKTTQLRLLADRFSGFQPLGAVHDHDPRTWQHVAGQGYARWWFETSSTPELTRMLLASHGRRAAARERGKTGLLDRGLPMLLAVAAATCAVKENLSVGAALERVTALTPAAPLRETAVLLLPSLDPDRGYFIISAREGRPWTGVYPTYQRTLHETLLRQAERGVYGAVVLCDERSVADIHTEVADHLQAYLPISEHEEKGKP